MIEIRRNTALGLAEWKRGDGEHASRIHAHAEWSLGVVVSGSTTVMLGRERLRLSSGGFLAVPPGTLHVCMPEIESGFSYSTLYIDATAMPAAVPDSVWFAHSGSVSPSDIEDACGAMMRCTDRVEFAALFDAVSTLLNRGSTRAFGRTATVPFDGDTSRMRKTVEARFREYRASRRTYGVGAHAITQVRRIESSKRLLRDGAAIVDAAAECGYFDQSHYDKTFRLYTGLTPSAYRDA